MKKCWPKKLKRRERTCLHRPPSASAVCQQTGVQQLRHRGISDQKHIGRENGTLCVIVGWRVEVDAPVCVTVKMNRKESTYYTPICPLIITHTWAAWEPDPQPGTGCAHPLPECSSMGPVQRPEFDASNIGNNSQTSSHLVRACKMFARCLLCAAGNGYD